MHLIPAGFNFGETIHNITNSQDKEMFITFVKRMLKWDPQERSTAKDLLSDPWLYT